MRLQTQRELLLIRDPDLIFRSSTDCWRKCADTDDRRDQMVTTIDDLIKDASVIVSFHQLLKTRDAV